MLFSCELIVILFVATYVPSNGFCRLVIGSSCRIPNNKEISTNHFLVGTLQNYETKSFEQSDGKTHDFSAVESALRALNVNSTVHILSVDPLIYTVPNLLSAEECDAYKQYIRDQENQHRSMTRSNPPEVSLDLSKLWPLPVLSLLAGIPPFLQLIPPTDDAINLIEVTISSAMNIVFSLCAMGILVFVVAVPLIQSISNLNARTSYAMALNLEEDIKFVHPLVMRATASVLFQNVDRQQTWENWEAPVVTRYDPGAIFAKHGDASPTEGSEWKECGRQRLVTCICYLNTLNDGEGGETYFNNLGLYVKPTIGTGLFFFPADCVNLKADERTIHESMKPTTEKWIVQMFGRAERVPEPLGLPNSFALE